MNTPQKIGKVVKDLRTKSGLSQEQLSAKAGVDQHYVSNIENGQRNPSVEVVERLATFFGFTLSRFFAEVENLEENPTIENNHVIVGDTETERFYRYITSQNRSDATAKNTVKAFQTVRV